MTITTPIAPTVLCNSRKTRTSRVLYRGRTWAVTTYGIERHTGIPYYVEKNWLLERRDTGLLEWPVHIADKGMNYDFADFAHCFVKALELFGIEVPAEALRASLEEAITEHADSNGHSLRHVRGNHWRLRHPASAIVFTTSTPSCARALRNAAADLRRVERQHPTLIAGRAPAQPRTER